MAGNLTGMFAQLNQGIMRNPLVTGAGESLINSGIKGFGGAFGAATGEDKYGFMNMGAKQLEGQEALSSMDLSTIDGKAEAAKILGKIGKPLEAMKLATQVKEQRETEANVLMQNKVKASLLDIVSKDSTITPEDRQYYYDAINAGSIASRADYLEAKRGTKGDIKSSSDTSTVRDEAGNYFTRVTMTDGTGNVWNKWAPYSGMKGPEEPVGRVVPVSSTTGQHGDDTQKDRLELAGVQSRLRMSEEELRSELASGRIDENMYADIKKAQAQQDITDVANWRTERNEMVMNLPALKLAEIDTQKTLALLDTTATSGIATSINKMKDYFGLGDTATPAELNAHMSQYVLDNLRSMGANPTEGERAFLINAAGNMQRGTEANVALFQKTLQRIQMNAKAGQYLMDNPTASRDEYVREYNNIIKKEVGTVRIKLGDR